MAFQKLGVGVDLIIDPKSITKTEQQLKLFKEKQERALRKLEMGKGAKFLDTKDLESYRKSVNSLSKDTPNLRQNMQNLSSALGNISVNAQQANTGIKRLSSELVYNARKFAEYMGIGGLILGVIRGVQDAIDSIVKMDTAMTNLAKVSGESEENLSKYKDTVYDTAKAMGVLAEDVVDATSVFARAGYSLSESSDLGKSAILLTNVADSFQDVGTSGEQIISILKGFGLEASSAFDIVDKINELSNQYNVTNTDLAMGLKRSSAVMAGYGNDVDQVNAMLTASISVLGNWEKSSRGLNTIGARLQGMTEDGEKDGEMVAKLNGLFNEFGLTLEKSDGTFKSTYDIINELASIQDTLGKQDPKKFQYLLEQISGKDQLPVLRSLLVNIKDMNSSLEVSKTAFGSAEQEQARYLESIEGRTKSTQASIQKFYNTLISSDAIKTAVTGFGQLVDMLTMLTDEMGGMPVILGLATTALALFNRELLITTGTAMVGFINSIPTLIALTKEFGVVSALSAAGVTSLHIAIMSLVGIVGVIGAGMIYVAQQEKEFAEAQKLATDESQRQTKEFQNMQEESGKLMSSLSDLVGVKELSVEQDKRISEVTLQLQKLFPNLLANLDKEGNKLENLVKAYNAVSKAALQSQVSRLAAEQMSIETELSKEQITGKYGPRGLAVDAGLMTAPETAKTKAIRDRLRQNQSEFAKAQRELIGFKGITTSDLAVDVYDGGAGGGGASGGAGGSKASKATEDVLKQFQSYRQSIADVSHELTILQSRQQTLADDDYPALKKSQQSIIAQYKLEQTAIAAYGQELRKAISSGKYSGEELQKLRDELAQQGEKWWAVSASIAGANKAIDGYNKSAQDLIEKKLSDVIDKATDSFSDLSDVIDDSIDSIDSEIDSLKRKQDALDAEYDRKKLLLEVEEARAKLANVQAERNVKLYTGQGITGWEFVADPQEVQSAQESLNDAKEKLYEFDVEASQKAEIQKLEDEKKAFQERKQEFEKFQRDIEEAMKNHSDQVDEMLDTFLAGLTEAERASYGTRIADMQNFVAQYKALQAQLTGALGTEEFYAGSGDIQDRGGGRKTGDTQADLNRDKYLRENKGALAGEARDKAQGKAIGGPVNAGQMYRVNENGMESMLSTINGKDYLTPLTNGKILTAPQTNKALSGGMSNGQPSFVIENLTVQANNSNELISSLKMRANLISPIK